MSRFFIVLCLCFTSTTAFADFIPEFSPVWQGGEQGSADIAGKTFTEPTTGMKFVFIKGGCFMMGSDYGSDDEKPVHEVCVDDFWMGKFGKKEKGDRLLF